jgi:glutathione S-transferase
MDLSLRGSVEVSEATHNDLRRLVELWSGLLARFGGQFLVGDWSIADAFFTPVATRLRSYGLHLSDDGDQGLCAAYATRLLQAPEFLEWEQAALAAI